MDYPVMSEWQVVHRWKISAKTLRRWRASGEGLRWHKLFNLVRYHKADVLEFERRERSTGAPSSTTANVCPRSSLAR